MVGARAKTRLEWIQSVLGKNRSNTVGNFKRCRTQLAERGRVMAAASEGPAYEKVVVVTRDCPAYPLVRAYAGGTRWFSIAELSRVVDAAITERVGVVRLAFLGFALENINGNRVELRVADPRAARFINESRLGPQLRGFSTRRVIEALLLVRCPGRCRINISDERRFATAVVLQEEWQIGCDDLLSNRRRVRLFSSWTMSDAVATNNHSIDDRGSLLEVPRLRKVARGV